MIEDAIMEILEEHDSQSVCDLIGGLMEDLDCTREQVEDAIINLEDQGRVRGYSDGTFAWIEAVPPKEDARVAGQEGSP